MKDPKKEIDPTELLNYIRSDEYRELKKLFPLESEDSQPQVD